MFIGCTNSGLSSAAMVTSQNVRWGAGREMGCRGVRWALGLLWGVKLQRGCEDVRWGLGTQGPSALLQTLKLD